MLITYVSLERTCQTRTVWTVQTTVLWYVFSINCHFSCHKFIDYSLLRLYIGCQQQVFCLYPDLQSNSCLTIHTKRSNISQRSLHKVAKEVYRKLSGVYRQLSEPVTAAAYRPRRRLLP